MTINILQEYNSTLLLPILMLRSHVNEALLSEATSLFLVSEYRYYALSL